MINIPSQKDIQNQTKKKAYDPYKIIKRVKEAKQTANDHKLATKFGKLPQKISAQKTKFCQCCHRPEIIAKFKLSENSNVFSNYSPTLSIYFKFITFCVFVLIFNFVMVGIYNIAYNKTIRGCFLNKCNMLETDFSYRYNSTFNQILIFVNILIMIIAKYLFFNYIRKFNFMKDEERITPSDYTILIKGLKLPGKNDDLKKQLEGYFKSYDAKIEVEKINYIYNISDYVGVVKSFLKTQKKISILQYKNKPKEKIDPLRVKANELKNKLEKLMNEYKNKMKSKFTGEAFVTFSKQSHMRTVVEKSHTNIFFMKLQKGVYKIKRAKEPNDIIWENFGLTKTERFIKKLISFTITFIIIAISFGIIYSFKYIQRKNTIQFLYSIFISITISLINAILRFILKILTTSEKNTFFTYKESSLVYKLIIASFTNSGLIVVVVCIIINNNDMETTLWGSGGIAANLYVIMMFSFLLDIVYGLVSPFHLLQKCKRYYINSKLKKLGKKVVLQCELNDVYQGINFDFAERFYQVFRVLALAFFFQTILPYGLLIAVVHLLLVKIIYKRELIRYCNRPKDIDFGFSMKMIANFELCTFLLACGFLTFSELTDDNLNPLALTAVIITGIDWLVFDVKYVYNYFHKKNQKSLFVPKDRGYPTECIDFPTDYDRMNPTTQKRAYEDWLLSLQNRKDKKQSRSIIPKSKKSYLTPDEAIPTDFLKTIYDYVQVNNDSDTVTNDITLLDLQGKQKNVMYNDLNIYAFNNLASYNNNQSIMNDVRLRDDPYAPKPKMRGIDDVALPKFLPTEDLPLGYGGNDNINLGNLKSNFFFDPQMRGRQNVFNNNYQAFDNNPHLGDLPLIKEDLTKKHGGGNSPDQPLLKSKTGNDKFINNNINDGRNRNFSNPNNYNNNQRLNNMNNYGNNNNFGNNQNNYNFGNNNNFGKNQDIPHNFNQGPNFGNDRKISDNIDVPLKKGDLGDNPLNRFYDPKNDNKNRY